MATNQMILGKILRANMPINATIHIKYIEPFLPLKICVAWPNKLLIMAFLILILKISDSKFQIPNFRLQILE